MMHSPHVEKIPGGGSEMILPFNFKKIAPPRPQKNQMRPPVVSERPLEHLEFFRPQPTHSGREWKRTVLPTWTRAALPKWKRTALNRINRI